MQSDQVTLIFKEDSEALNPEELGDFIFLFRSVYSVASERLKNVSLEEYGRETDKYNELVLHDLNSAKLLDICQIFEQTPRESFLISKIQKASPLEIVMVGFAAAIIAAAIIAGGDIEVWGIKAKLNPLGDGIAKLRKAYNFKTGVVTGYVVKINPVTLSNDEYAMLMLPLKGQGGFQNLLTDLQGRVDKRTKILKLYPPDIDKIRGYGKDSIKNGADFRKESI